MFKEKLIEDLEHYYTTDKKEQEMVLDTLEFLKQNDDVFGKRNPKGHITGSTWIVNKEYTKCLLTHHRKLNIWVQLGGHTEKNETVFESAYREGIEESGYDKLIEVSREIFDVDVHLIPKKKDPAHFHYDIRYMFIADSEENFTVSEESHDLKWIELKDIKDYTLDEAVLRMVRKMEVYVGNQ